MNPSVQAIEAAAGLATGHFTPVHALMGGLILGVAVAGKLLTTGRVLGISGAIKGLVAGDTAPSRVAFLAGLAVGGIAIAQLVPTAVVPMRASFPVVRAAVSGLLVGVGVSLGNGCTSGHGVCGLARFSYRSMAYTVTFMLTGMVTATLLHTVHFVGLAASAPQLLLPTAAEWRILGGVLAAAVGSFAALVAASKALGAASSSSSSSSAVGDAEPNATRRPVISTGAFELAAEGLSGTVFGAGLGLSGMADAAKVAAFLSPLFAGWDLTLAFVMGGAVLVALVAYQGVMRFNLMTRPLYTQRFQLPTNNVIDARLLVGGVLFGAGWGMSGLCPGPALLNAAALLDPHMLSYLAAMVVGMGLEARLLNAAKTPVGEKA